jgi:protocatechuate 3,4-dioxygenase beta subunit
VGKVTHLTGRVLDLKGNSVNNAVVEIWQCDAKGVYLHTRDSSRKERDKSFQGFGRCPTPGGRRTSHFKVKKGGKELLTTQCYVKGEARNDHDFIFRSIAARSRPAVLVDFAPIKGSRIGELAAKFDIVLGITPEA